MGVHIPQEAGTLHDYQRLARRLESGGYDRIWVGEVNGVDAVTTATLAALGTERARVSMFVNVFTRAPTTLAMTAAALAAMAPGRFELVLGTGSRLFVESWNGIPHRHQYPRLRDTLRFVRIALSGERAREPFTTIAGRGFALASAPEPPPMLCVAASGPRALALAADEADGVALNWITPADLARTEPLPADQASVTLVVPVCPTPDRTLLDQTMRPVVATYLNVPGYAQQQRRLGRGAVLAPMWRAWLEGDAVAARAALPDEILDEFVVSGSPEDCRTRLETIERATGVSVVAIVFPPEGTTFEDVMLP